MPHAIEWAVAAHTTNRPLEPKTGSAPKNRTIQPRMFRAFRMGFHSAIAAALAVTSPLSTLASNSVKPRPLQAGKCIAAFDPRGVTDVILTSLSLSFLASIARFREQYTDLAAASSSLLPCRAAWPSGRRAPTRVSCPPESDNRGWLTRWPPA